MGDLQRGREITWGSLEMSDLQRGRGISWGSMEMGDLQRGREITWGSLEMSDLERGSLEMSDLQWGRGITWQARRTVFAIGAAKGVDPAKESEGGGTDRCVTQPFPPGGPGGKRNLATIY